MGAGIQVHTGLLQMAREPIHEKQVILVLKDYLCGPKLATAYPRGLRSNLLCMTDSSPLLRPRENDQKSIHPNHYQGVHYSGNQTLRKQPKLWPIMANQKPLKDASKHLPTAAATNTTTAGAPGVTTSIDSVGGVFVTPRITTGITSVVVSTTSIGTPVRVASTAAAILSNVRVGALRLEMAHLLAVLALDTRDCNKSASITMRNLQIKWTYCREAWDSLCRCVHTHRNCGTERSPYCEAQCTPSPYGPPDHNCGNRGDQPWGSPWRNDRLEFSSARVLIDLEEKTPTLVAFATLDILSRTRLSTCHSKSVDKTSK